MHTIVGQTGYRRKPRRSATVPGTGGSEVENAFLQPPTCALSYPMSTQAPDKSSLPDPSYRWTTLKAQVFLGALADLGRVGEAARVVGMSRQSAYRLRARLGEGGLFAQVWDRAQAEGREKRQARLRRAGKATVLPPEDDIFGLGK
jgi:hypothetical protein